MSRQARLSFSLCFRAVLAVACGSLPGPLAAQLKLEVLHSFRGGGDGQQPEAALVEAADGVLYGTTFMGGTNNAGTIFKVNPDGSGNTPVYSFPKNEFNPFGLANPSGLVQGADGGLYGTTGSGGKGYGSVFRLQPDGSGFVTLHSFDAAEGGAYQPGAALVQGADGFLYGTTTAGGPFGAGIAFRLGTNGDGFLALHAFGAPGDALSPQAPMIQGRDGALYGTSAVGGEGIADGGSGYGTVFRLGTNGSGATVLHSFLPTGGDGQRAYGALVQDKDGVLYGVTQEGGNTAAGANSGFGTVFRIQADGSGYQILHNFNPAVDGDGKYPWAGLAIGNDGGLYGTTTMGGAYNCGVVFRLNRNGTGYRILYAFGSSPTDGQYPRSPLVRAKRGGLFGTAPFGGEINGGILFRLAPAPVLITAIDALPDKTMRVSFTGEPNFEYRVEASTDKRHWEPIGSVSNSTGVVQVTDPAAPGHAQRYYRAAWIP